LYFVLCTLMSGQRSFADMTGFLARKQSTKTKAQSPLF